VAVADEVAELAAEAALPPSFGALGANSAWRAGWPRSQLKLLSRLRLAPLAQTRRGGRVSS
jgi:hypothetical protein